jgi:transposase
VYDHWRRWQKRGVWQEAVLILNTRWREVELGRARRAPRHAILDSQSVKTAAEGQARGYHGGKQIKGRKAPRGRR